jgi:hypothetical protein
LTPAAVAQTGPTCTAFAANQPTLRQESTSEPAGDILVSCTGGIGGTHTVQVAVDKTTVTSRKLYVGTTPAKIPTEAALLINDCTTTSGTSPSGDACNANTAPVQGFLQNNVLIFSGVTLPSTAKPFLLRVTNLRVNANALMSGSLLSGSIVGTFPIANQVLVLGAVQSSLSLSISTPLPVLPQCNVQNVTIQNLTIRELTSTALKTTGSVAVNSIPGNWYQNGINNESQTVLVSTPGWTNPVAITPGLADTGTRLRVQCLLIPDGITIKVPTSVGTGAGMLVANATGDVGPFVPETGSDILITSAVPRSVTYEVRTQSPAAIDSFMIPITIAVTGNPNPAFVLAAVTYAPTTITAAPMFNDTAFFTPVFTLASCQPAARLVFSAEPRATVAGNSLPPVTVSVVDAVGNPTSAAVPVSLTSNPAALSATMTSVNGLATFNNLAFNQSGAYALTAASPGLTSVTSPSFFVQGATTTTLSGAGGTFRYGSPVMLTATVSPSAATGAVTFYDGATILGSATLSGGQATLSTLSLPAGSRSLKARYLGSPAYVGSLSQTSTATVLGVSANSLAAAVNYPAGNGPVAVAVGDLNGDGIPDLAVANRNSSEVSVLIGNGNGTFRAAVNYPVGALPTAVACGDFNMDGKLDIAVLTFEGTLALLFGNAGGTLQAPVTYAAGTYPVSLAVGDLNNDGIPDIAFVDAYGTFNTVRLFLGTADGTLRLQPYPYTAGSLVSNVILADFNADGNADLAVANSDGVSILLGNGDGTLRSPQLISTAYPAYALAAADFNGDGLLDLATAGWIGNSMNVLTGNGDGTFKTPTAYTVTGAPYAIATGDFNGDGKIDIAIANSSSNTVALYLNSGSGGLSTATEYAVGQRPQALLTADFNNDGRTDLVTANTDSLNATVLLGTTNDGFNISGRITLPGSGLAGVTVTLSGSQAAATTTDIGGNYTFALTAKGSYTVTPSAAGYTFLPSSLSFGNITSSQTANFNAIPSNYFAIYGTVTVGGNPLSGATVDINGTQTLSITTDPSGNYFLVVPKGGSYIVTAAASGYTFSGPFTFAALSANQTLNINGIAVPGLQFIPVAPCRVADTRAGGGKSGSFGPPALIAGEQRSFPIPASTCGIPANAAAYSLNFTVVPKGYLGFLTTWPTGQAEPVVSTLNSYTGTVVANAAIVPAGTNGAISVHVTDAAEVLFDINGYFIVNPTSGYYFHTVTPCRIADTRPGGGKAGAFGPPAMGVNGVRTFPIPTSSCGLPGNAAAYSLNFTVQPQGYLGFLTTWPAGQAEPVVSTLNSYNGTVVANAAIVPAGTSGAINVHVTDPTEVLFDVNGYFGAQAGNGLQFYPVAPCRVADTRVAAGKTGPLGPPSMTAGERRSFPVPASTCGIPPNASAYSLNITVVPKGYLGFLTTWPTGQGEPIVSTLNSYNGQVVANAAIVPAGAGGAISIHVTDAADVLFDINGYFAQ